MLRLVSILAVVLLVACSTSGGSGDPDEQRCAIADDCPASSPFCVENVCVACAENSHCNPARFLCIDGACWGPDCADDDDCEGTTPICDLGLCVGTCKANGDCEAGEVCWGNGTCGPCSVDSQCDEGQLCFEGGICGEPVVPPDLLIVLDRSGSMQICAPGAAGPDGARCDANGDSTLDTDGASRWDVVRGALADPTWLGLEQKIGLVVAGVGGDDPACGEAEVLVPPGSDPAWFADVWTSNQALVETSGGTPTSAALALAAEQTASSADMRVVLITDGIANCNFDHAMPCICANESGCISEDGSSRAPFLEEGTFLDGRFCLDDTEGLKAVQQLRAAGVRTAIVSVGESADALAPMSSLAEAGGLRAADATGIHHAADSAALVRVLQTVLAEE